MITLPDKILGFTITVFEEPAHIKGTTLFFGSKGSVTITHTGVSVTGNLAAAMQEQDKTVTISDSMATGGSSVDASGGTVAIGGKHKGNIVIGGNR